MTPMSRSELFLQLFSTDCAKDCGVTDVGGLAVVLKPRCDITANQWIRHVIRRTSRTPYGKRRLPRSVSIWLFSWLV
jgi:hypothetical protein